MELLMLCHVFPQWEENLRAENTQIVYQLDGPLHQSFYLHSARLPSATRALSEYSGIKSTRELVTHMKKTNVPAQDQDGNA